MIMSNNELEKIQENIFGLEDPDSWGCKVDYYISGHSQLGIRAYNENLDENINLGFEDVEYFSGSIDWTGANFCLHSREECIKFWTNYRPGFQNTVNMLVESNMMRMFKWKLYSIPTNEGNLVYIIAGNGGLSHANN